MIRRSRSAAAGMIVGIVVAIVAGLDRIRSFGFELDLRIEERVARVGRGFVLDDDLCFRFCFRGFA